MAPTDGSLLAGRIRNHTVAFTSPESAMSGITALRRAGFDVVDAHTPFAVHGMDEALGFPETRLPWGTFVGGVIGLGLGMGFQLWTHAIDWPLNIGGKSAVAWQALVPIGFEVVVLIAAFATVGTLLVRGQLFPRLADGKPAAQPHLGVTDDRFVLIVEERDGAFSAPRFQRLCDELGAEEVVNGWVGPPGSAGRRS